MFILSIFINNNKRENVPHNNVIRTNNSNVEVDCVFDNL